MCCTPSWLCKPTRWALRSVDSILPVVPMFHANAWAIAFSAPMVGAKLVMPGAKLDGDSDLRASHQRERDDDGGGADRVAGAAALSGDRRERRLPDLKRVLIGGSAAPRSMIETFEKKYGVTVIHAWGMTEMSPLGTVGTLKPGMAELPYEKQLDYKCKQGHPLFGVEMKIVDDENRELPRDGKAFGRLKVRGPAVAKGYFRGEGTGAFDEDGWFDTGDVATLDPDGYMTITDRAKDVIKSGGEWISSIEIENIAVGHPAVAEAAVIGVRHPKWDERPLLIVVLKHGAKAATRDEILQYLTGKIAKWWMPDDVAVRRRNPAHRHGQDPEDRAARTLRRLSLAQRGGLRQGEPMRILAKISFAGFVLALAAGLIAGLGTRLGLWPFTTGLKMLVRAARVRRVRISVGADLGGDGAGQEHRRGRALGPDRADRLGGGADPADVRLYVAKTSPPIHDISTDIEHPPQFEALLPLRKGAMNGPDYDGPKKMKMDDGKSYTTSYLQRKYYGDIHTIAILTPPEKLFNRALEAAKDMGWNIVAVAPDEGRIEATDTSLFFGFTDDIVIRVKPSGMGAKLDIRSKSRVGVSDVGKNAARIRAYVKTLAGTSG